MNESLQKILELDLRHNELLDRLTDLDAKISAVLEEWTGSTAASSQPSGASGQSLNPET